MQANILEALDELESCHQELKREYLQWAKGNLPNNGIGAEHNGETLEVLGKCKAVEEINARVGMVKNLSKNTGCQERYEILREIYAIHPSFHELWFFDGHFNHLTGDVYSKRISIVFHRCGLNSYLTSYRRGTLEKRIKSVSTFVLKQTILSENLFSGVLGCSLFDFDALNDEQFEAKIIDLNKLSNPSPDELKSKMPDLFEITKTLLDKTEYDALKTDKLLESGKWLSYAPCDINEGPIFKKRSGKRRIDILKRINSINQNEIRSELSKYFKISEEVYRIPDNEG